MTVFCTDKTRIPESDMEMVFGKRHSIDILLFIDKNPGCGKKDIYQAFGHGKAVSDRLLELVESGLVADDQDVRAQSYSLTTAGKKIASILLEAKEAMQILFKSK